MPSNTAAAPSSDNIRIDLRKDLGDASHLKALLQENRSAVLAISAELSQYAAQPVRTAAGGAAAKVTLSAPASWKTSGGIAFSLTPEASCAVAIASASAKFPVAKSVDSSETEDIAAGPEDGKVWVNIEMDFSIAGNVSGSGTAGTVGISGKASASGAATLSYCHAVDGGMATEEALAEAFRRLVLPLEPDCALAMEPGDVARVSFNGSLSFGLGVTYGLGSSQFSAPGAAAVRQSVERGFEKLALPAATVKAGIQADGSYTHTDRFAAIVRKTSAAAARLYLVRSSEDEAAGGAGITVGVTASQLKATLDRKALAGAVDGVTGSGGDQAAALADELQASLVSRTNQWLSSRKGDAGLQVHLERQKNRALLYEFQVDLTKAELTRQSWQKLAEADVAAAMKIGGLTLLPGSGVTAALERSVTVGLHFFNFFSATEKDAYFRKAATEVGPDGSIRYLYDLGNESSLKTKHALATSRVHFLASATAADRERPGAVEVKLAAELSEQGKAEDGRAIAGAAEALGTKARMLDFVKANPQGKVTLSVVLQAAAYGRLATAGGPDRANWQAFHDAVAAHDRDLGPRIARLGYEDWEAFHRYACGGAADRRTIGNPAAVPESFYEERGLGGIGAMAAYFLVASQRTMNLFEGLAALAGEVKTVDTAAAWDRLLEELTALSKDLQSDWTRPMVRALLERCGAGPGAPADVRTQGTALVCMAAVS